MSENRITADRKLPHLTALSINPSVNLKNPDSSQPVRPGYQPERGDRSPENALEVYTAAARQGDPVGMNNLGCLYWKKQDISSAKKYLQKAADLGCTIAMINLGSIAEYGLNYEEAYLWDRKAYILGDPAGQFYYTLMYDRGLYVEQDYDFAYHSFKQLAEAGYADAFYYVGHYLQQGLGGDAEAQTAFQYFQAGEQAGDAFSTAELGRCYIEGLGVKKDAAKGLRYYREAAERGDSKVYEDIGRCFEEGIGTEKNLDLARQYYGKGAEHGEKNCAEAIKRLNKSAPHKKEAADAYDESFLARMQEIGGEQGKKTAEFLMKAVRAMGIRAGYSNGTVFTSAVMNIAPRSRPSGDYVRLEHRISKLAGGGLEEKTIARLFGDFGVQHRLWNDKQLKVQGGSYFLEMTALYDEKVLHGYIALIRTFALLQLPEDAEVEGLDKLWQMYLKIMGGTGVFAPQDIDREYHNEVIEAAVHRYVLDRSEMKMSGIVLALHRRLLEEGKVLIPVVYDEKKSGGKRPGTIPIGVKTTRGNLVLPIFTSEEKDGSNPNWTTFASMTLKKALETTHGFDSKNVGIVINPYTEEEVIVDYQYVDALLESVSE